MMRTRYGLGWIIELAGTALWIYGYFVTGHSPIVDWQTKTPWWLAKWVPNFESELGLFLVIAGTVLMYWPDRDKTKGRP